MVTQVHERTDLTSRKNGRVTATAYPITAGPKSTGRKVSFEVEVFLNLFELINVALSSIGWTDVSCGAN
jgi:hypothetical protein